MQRIVWYPEPAMLLKNLLLSPNLANFQGSLSVKSQLQNFSLRHFQCPESFPFTILQPRHQLTQPAQTRLVSSPASFLYVHEIALKWLRQEGWREEPVPAHSRGPAFLLPLPRAAFPWSPPPLLYLQLLSLTLLQQLSVTEGAARRRHHRHWHLCASRPLRNNSWQTLAKQAGKWNFLEAGKHSPILFPLPAPKINIRGVFAGLCAWWACRTCVLKTNRYIQRWKLE